MRSLPEAVFESMLYVTDLWLAMRYNYTWDTWFQLIKGELDQNRPLQYGILTHAIVCDGYKSGFLPYYHMNCGWADGYNTWYLVDNVYQVGGGTPVNEIAYVGMRPWTSLGSAIFGNVPLNPVFQ